MLFLFILLLLIGAALVRLGIALVLVSILSTALIVGSGLIAALVLVAGWLTYRLRAGPTSNT